MVGEVAGVVLRAVDEARLAAAQERAARSRTGRARRDDAAVVAELALAVEDRHVEPRVVRPEPGRPDDRARSRRCAGRARAAAGRRRGSAPSRCGGSSSPSMPLPSAHSSIRSSRRVQLEVGEVADVAQRAGELRGAVARSRVSRPTSSTPDAVSAFRSRCAGRASRRAAATGRCGARTRSSTSS